MIEARSLNRRRLQIRWSLATQFTICLVVAPLAIVTVMFATHKREVCRLRRISDELASSLTLDESIDYAFAEFEKNPKYKTFSLNEREYVKAPLTTLREKLKAHYKSLEDYHNSPASNYRD